MADVIIHMADVIIMTSAIWMTHMADVTIHMADVMKSVRFPICTRNFAPLAAMMGATQYWRKDNTCESICSRSCS